MATVKKNSLYLLTVCIPTYNRCRLLKRLVENIKTTCSSLNEIEIIVVDDGSTDDTAEYARQIMNNLDIKIGYFFKKNEGKLSAVLSGLNESNGRYFMNMDVDDLFPKSGLDTILEQIKLLDIETISNTGIRPIIGIAGLTITSNGKNIGTKFPKSPLITNFAKIRADYRVTGDKKEVILSDYLREVSIGFFPNEKRTPSSSLWLSLSFRGDIKFLNKTFIIKDYRHDGLTMNLLPIRVSCPNNSMSPYKVILELKNYSSLMFRFRASINFWRFRFHGAKKQKIAFPNVLFFLVHCALSPLGFFLAITDKALLLFKN